MLSRAGFEVHPIAYHLIEYFLQNVAGKQEPVRGAYGIKFLINNDNSLTPRERKRLEKDRLFIDEILQERLTFPHGDPLT